MLRRLGQWLYELVYSLDQFAGVVIFGACWVGGLLAEEPNADETISSRVGRYAVRGRPWALWAERAINSVMDPLDDFFYGPDPRGHCRRWIEWSKVDAR